MPLATRDVTLLPSDEVALALSVDPSVGLSPAEVAARQDLYGRNELRATPPDPAWRRFLRQFADPLIYLLLAAIVISIIAWVVEGGTGLPVDAIVIAVIVVANAVIGFVQENRAERRRRRPGRHDRHPRHRAARRTPRLRPLRGAGPRGRARPRRGRRRGRGLPPPHRHVPPHAGGLVDRRIGGHPEGPGRPPGARGHRRPPQHGVQGHLRGPRRGPRGGHRPPAWTPRWGASPPCWTRPQAEPTPLQARDRQDLPDAGTAGGRDSRGGDAHHRPGQPGQHARGRRRDPADGRLAGRGRRPGGPARDPVARARHRGPGHGAPQRGDEGPPLGGDAGVGLRDLLGQDRHPHPQRDDAARGGDGLRQGHPRRHRVHAGGRGAGGGRRRTAPWTRPDGRWWPGPWPTTPSSPTWRAPGRSRATRRRPRSSSAPGSSTAPQSSSRATRAPARCRSRPSAR